MHPSEMQAVRVRYSVEFESVILIPRPDGTGEDTDARRDAALDALEAINLPNTGDVQLLDDSFRVIECTDEKSGKVTCQELRLI